MTIRSVATIAVVVGVMSWPCVAAADVPPRDASHRPSKLFAGFEIGFMRPPTLWIDGKRATEGEAKLNGGFHAGYSHSLGRYFALLGLTRFGTWNTPLAGARGEGRYRVDLALGPELRIGDGWHVSAPMGVTIAQSGAGTGRAVRDWYGPGRGLNFGLAGGFAFPGLHSAYFDLAWRMHVTWIDHFARLLSSGAVAKESYEYVDHQLLLVVGYLYRL